MGTACVKGIFCYQDREGKILVLLQRVRKHSHRRQRAPAHGVRSVTNRCRCFPNTLAESPRPRDSPHSTDLLAETPFSPHTTAPRFLPSSRPSRLCGEPDRVCTPCAEIPLAVAQSFIPCCGRAAPQCHRPPVLPVASSVLQHCSRSLWRKARPPSGPQQPLGGYSMSRHCWSPHSEETQLPAPCVPPMGVLPAPNSRPIVESAVRTPHASGDHIWKDISSSFCIFPPFPALTSRPVSQSCCLSQFYKRLQPVTCSSGTCLGADTAPPGTPGRSTCPLHTGVPRSQLRTASSQGVLHPFPTSR